MANVFFADSFYWIASITAKDQWHSRVLAWGRAHPAARIVTTEEVVIEVLNWFASAGSRTRRVASLAVRDVIDDPAVQVIPQSSASFHAAWALYDARPDKAYSLTDCRSMVAMKSLGLVEVLSNDHHFAQEGFTVLFP